LAAAAGKPLPPDHEWVNSMKQKLRDGYKVELANSGKKERGKLVKTMLERAKSTRESDHQFAMLELASDTAMESGDFALAMETCAEISRLFFVDVSLVKAETIVRGERDTPTDAAAKA
jgi:hypothetical protein